VRASARRGLTSHPRSTPTTNGRAGTHCTDNRDDRYTAYMGDLCILPDFLLYARTHAPIGKPWFTITSTHTFTTSGTRTLMSQHQLHTLMSQHQLHRTVSDNIA
jgi:hypothetical protein